MCRVLFLPLLFFCFRASSQVKIWGKITDNHNKAVGSVSISIKDSYDGTTSDSTGKYSFTTSEKGGHILEASASGYKTFEENINVTSSPLNINIPLKEEIT